MDLPHLLSHHSPMPEAGQSLNGQPRQNHPYPTRSANAINSPSQSESHSIAIQQTSYNGYSSPTLGLSDGQEARMPPKTINFQLLLSHTPQHRARLPLRVHIQPHDTTSSIITTVKNFYGLYEGQGVSFEDAAGYTLITRYENLAHNSIVYVRVTSEEPVQEMQSQPTVGDSNSPRRPHLDEPFQMPLSQPHSRPNSRTMKSRELSPLSAKGYTNGSTRAPSTSRVRNANDEFELAQGLSDNESISSSRRAKSDHLASAEISLDNIVEGGRRKKAKFESSELPLFAPPQQPMTASMSSLSPQRRFTNNAIRSPMPFSNQYTFSYNPMLPSPQSLEQNGYATPRTGGSVGSGHLNIQVQPHSHHLRGRESGLRGPSRLSGSSARAVLPTPDPTIASAISDEDVALQLMRLGDPTNQSLRTSTIDDALSGKAELASSVEGSSDGGDHERLNHYSHHLSIHHSGPARKKLKGSETMIPRYSSEESSGEEAEDQLDKSFNTGSALDRSKGRPSKSSKPRTHSASSKGPSKSKAKAAPSNKGEPSPYPGDSASRKASSASSTPFQQQLGEDEEDLSAKPRCQRCRKSKKGCDRQRPCQRCKDAGIGIEGCISEDEGNGRKGRFGRLMGVPIKKSSLDDYSVSEPTPFIPQEAYTVDPYTALENGKKRKR